MEIVHVERINLDQEESFQGHAFKIQYDGFCSKSTIFEEFSQTILRKYLLWCFRKMQYIFNKKWCIANCHQNFVCQLSSKWTNCCNLYGIQSISVEWLSVDQFGKNYWKMKRIVFDFSKLLYYRPGLSKLWPEGPIVFWKLEKLFEFAWVFEPKDDFLLVFFKMCPSDSITRFKSYAHDL